MPSSSHTPLIAIRTDASLTIGTGHVMRCLTLADALRHLGADVHFLMRDYAGEMSAMVRERGYHAHRILLATPEPAKDQLDPHQLEDASASLPLLQQLPTRPHSLILDHYSLSQPWESLIRDHVGQMMVIDDLANRPHDADILLDYTPKSSHAYDALLNPDCERWLGLSYLLLRPEFTHWRQQLQHNQQRDWQQISHLLVFIGGSDPDNVTGWVMHALSDARFAHLHMDCVIGQHHPARESLQQLSAQRPQFHVHIQATNMAELMAKAQLAIGAGGTATWERLALGLPTYLLLIAENQLPNRDFLKQQGLLFGGFYPEQDISAAAFQQDILNLCHAPTLLQQNSEQALQLIPQNTTAQVAARLLSR